MRPVITKYTISNWYYLLIVFVLAICSYITMPDFDNTADAGTGLSFIAMFGLAAIQLPYLLFIFGERMQTKTVAPRFIIYYGIYFFWMTAVCILTNVTHNIFGLVTISMTILLFPFTLSTGYFRSRYSPLDTKFFIAVIFVLLCIVLQYKNIYSIANQVSEESSHIAVSYYPLFILPVLLLPSSRIVRYASIAITSIIIISSIKRGGIIALGASLMVYIFIKQHVSGRSKILQIIILLIAFSLMGGVIYYLSRSEENNIIERISNARDDGGSSRDVLWEDTYHNIQNRDIDSRIVGDGYRAAQRVSKYHLPAHNDFLEIWYDFGGIGVFLYGLAFLSLFVYTIRLIKRKSQYAPHLAMTLTFYFIFAMVSIVILYFWMTLLMFSMGIIAGLADRELEEKNKTIQQ